MFWNLADNWIFMQHTYPEFPILKPLTHIFVISANTVKMRFTIHRTDKDAVIDQQRRIVIILEFRCFSCLSEETPHAIHHIGFRILNKPCHTFFQICRLYRIIGIQWQNIFSWSLPDGKIPRRRNPAVFGMKKLDSWIRNGICLHYSGYIVRRSVINHYNLPVAVSLSYNRIQWFSYIFSLTIRRHNDWHQRTIVNYWHFL